MSDDNPLRECPCCLRLRRDVERRPRNTNYVNDELNYLTACGDCQARDDADLAELWKDYYSGRL